MLEVLELFDRPAVLHSIYLIGSLILFFIGLYGLLAKRHLLKIFVSIEIMELAVYLILIAIATTPGETAPILSDGFTAFTSMSDPIPQALTLTAIVIGVAVTALGTSMAIQYHRLTGKVSVGEMTELKD
ncbi:sodium:proton antiporter [Chromatium okenii]|uniref:sodium:proton antiporter n=1 Tax=Chromatium okenii TaxID=61644 RepID=UPI001907E21E|nr:sodium:proton antiporter [Chromatium okenii]MBK1642323.1 sodium:proton antiporter [Chromatium okenii]